jgi:hypothetical protein
MNDLQAQFASADPRLIELLDGYCNGRLTEADQRELDRRLAVDDDAAATAVAYCDLHAVLSWMHRGTAAPQPIGKITPAVKPHHPRLRINPARFAAAVVVLSIGLACGLLVQMTSRMKNESRPSAAPVAVLIDTRDVVWSDPAHAPTPGEQLRPGWLKIERGQVEIAFGSGATVVIEGPCEFGLNSPGRGFLRSGKLRATVPTVAHGFTIGAKGFAVVDLGTEFTLAISPSGQGQVRVLKGRVEVRSEDGQRATATLDETKAANIDGATGHVSEIAEAPALATRTVFLADIVAGGDGGGSAKSSNGIDAATGRITRDSTRNHRPGELQYHRVSTPGGFIDGVFTADGSSGPVTVTSTGLKVQLPRTTRGLFDYIKAEPNVTCLSTMDGIDFSTAGHTMIALHANAGITFDLQSLAKAQQAQATRFTAVMGLANALGTATVRVYVDGRLVAERFFDRVAAGIALDVPLAKTDRFLTLVATDGDLAGPVADIGSDQVVFGDPQIHLSLPAKPGESIRPILDDAGATRGKTLDGESP